MSWDVRVDFNTYPGPDLVYGNARHAERGVVVRHGAVLTLGDEDWGVVEAEIVEYDEATGTFTARLLGDIVAIDEGAASTPCSRHTAAIPEEGAGASSLPPDKESGNRTNGA